MAVLAHRLRTARAPVDEDQQSNRDASGGLRGTLDRAHRFAARVLLCNEVVWDHFAHGADIGVRGRGDSRAQAFAEAARALTAVVTDPAKVSPLMAVPIRCTAPDDELLLVEWLNAVIYEMSTRRMVFGQFDVWMQDHALVAAAWGEPLEVARHQPAVEPKAATMTALRVASEPAPSDPGATWIAQTVLDV